MNCKLAKKYMMLLMDNELDECLKFNVEKHIHECNICKKEYNRLLKVNELLKPDSFLLQIEDSIFASEDSLEPDGRRVSQYISKICNGGFNMKKAIVSICLSVFIVTFAFIPVNGKSIVAGVKELVNRLTIKYTDNVHTGLNAEISVEATTDLTMEEVEEVRVMGEPYSEGTRNDKYATVDELKRKIGMDFYTPEYMTNGLELKEISDLNNSFFPNKHNILLRYLPDGNKTNFLPGVDGVEIVSIDVCYDLDKNPKITEGYKSTYKYLPGTKIKEVEVSGVKGFAVEAKKENMKMEAFRFELYKVNFFVRGEIIFHVDNQEVSKALEQEISKVAESIINRY